MRQRPTIDYVGSILVLLVVVLVPTFLGALSNSTLPAHDAALTTADASATALHALGQELQSKTLPPIQALAAGPTWWNAARTPIFDACAQDIAVAPMTTASDVAIEAARLL